MKCLVIAKEFDLCNLVPMIISNRKPNEMHYIVFPSEDNDIVKNYIKSNTYDEVFVVDVERKQIVEFLDINNFIQMPGETRPTIGYSPFINIHIINFKYDENEILASICSLIDGGFDFSRAEKTIFIPC